jgi:hypothetical protein
MSVFVTTSAMESQMKEKRSGDASAVQYYNCEIATGKEIGAYLMEADMKSLQSVRSAITRVFCLVVIKAQKALPSC